jgi:hypothetical protein
VFREIPANVTFEALRDRRPPACHLRDGALGEDIGSTTKVLLSFKPALAAFAADFVPLATADADLLADLAAFGPILLLLIVLIIGIAPYPNHHIAVHAPRFALVCDALACGDSQLRSRLGAATWSSRSLIAAAIGIATSAPIMPRSAPPMAVATTVTSPGTATVRVITRGVSR